MSVVLKTDGCKIKTSSKDRIVNDLWLSDGLSFKGEEPGLTVVDTA
jgi:hypothetical protein